MRRLPLSHRSIDQLLPSILPLRPSTCRSASALYYSNSSPFSSTPNPQALFSSKEKPDPKKKHQAFIRRWQKRLLGEAEPVGAHVDPYDKTSPVRIAPEEQGEEEELLEEMEEGQEWGYEAAEVGKGLERVGGEKWVRKFREWENREQWKQWKQSDSFAPKRKVTSPAELKDAIHRAIVEVFTMRKLGVSASSLSKNIKDVPWIKDVKIQNSSDGDLVSLQYPSNDLVQELVESTLPKTIVNLGSKIKLQDLPELTPEQILEMPEDQAISIETTRDLIQRAKDLQPLIEESKQEVGEIVRRARSKQLAAMLSSQSTSSSQTEKEFRLKDVPLTDLDLKFALTKRLTQLTGLRISDPNLLSIHHLADLYTQLLIASKPAPKKLFEEIVKDGKKKKVLSIPNVKFVPKRVTVVDKEKEVGRWKVIEFALKERGLPVTKRGFREE